jgi:hypothetical protein
MTPCRPFWRGIQGSVGFFLHLLHRLPSEALEDCGVYAVVRTVEVKGPAVGGARWTTSKLLAVTLAYLNGIPRGFRRIIHVNALGCCLHIELLFQGTMGS